MDETKAAIVISQEMPQAPDIPDDYIWINPNNMRWNDFKHITRAVISKVVGREVVAEYPARAAVWDEKAKEFVGVGNAIAAAEPKRWIVTEAIQVVSLAESQGVYRHLIRTLGVSDGVAFLRSTNDLVSISGDPLLREFEARVKSSDVFQYSLTRMSEAYYALKNSKPILRGLDQEDITSGPRSIKISLPNQKGGDVEIAFDFNHDIGIPKRTCVLIGKNGVGKSTALGNVARKAIKGIRKGARGDDDRVVASRVLAFTPGNEFTGTFPGEVTNNPATFYKRLSTSRLRYSTAGNTGSASIVELSRYDEMIAGKSRFDIFLDALSAINKPHEIALRSSVGGKVIHLRNIHGTSEQYRLGVLSKVNQAIEPGRVCNGKYYHLSTGEVRFIKLLAQACMFIENGSLILLDEPETHLHPNFVSRLMSALESLLSDTGSCAIIATHSVYVVREVFHDQVLIVEKDEEGTVNVRVPGMRTFGADISSISSFIFGDDGQSFLATDTIARLSKEHTSYEEVREKYGSFLSREILSAIKEKFQEI